MIRSLQTQIRYVYVFITISIFLLIWNEYNFSNKTLEYTHVKNELESISTNILQLRRIEKDFLLRKEEIYIQKFNNLAIEFKTEINRLSEKGDIFTITPEIKNDINIYVETFSKIATLTLEIGINKECGILSDLCKNSQQLEKNLKEQNLLSQSILHLQLRKAEKDFFLRKDMKYLELHKKYFKEFELHKMSVENKTLLYKYNKAFWKIAKKIQKIGLNENIALKGEMRNSIHNIEMYINKRNIVTSSYIETKLKELDLLQYIVYASILCLFIFIFFVLLKPIFNSIFLFKNFFQFFNNTSQRMDSSKLKFIELQDMASTLNHMISERQAVEESLLNSRDEAIRLQKVKEQFLSNMSHELRTPLNAIIGFSIMLQKRIPQEHKVIDPIVNSSKHLLQIVNDILDLSKIQSGKFAINYAVFELNKELDLCLNQFDSLIANKNITFTKNLDFDKKLVLNGDWLRISQILNNLMSNAIKFTPDSGVINFEMRYEKQHLMVSVKDNGVGMSTEVCKRILHPFEQADLSTSKEYGGTGLGLSISNTLAKMMGGEIVIKSKEGVGSTFTLSISLLEACSLESKVKPSENNDINININAHVLIAEDNKTNQLLLGLMLDDIGITYDIANDGEEAVDMYAKKKYDLVLMDENMPNLSGIEAMQEIKKKNKNVVPIIAVTANVMKGDEQRFFEAGMDGFIPKPVDTKQLEEILTKYL